LMKSTNRGIPADKQGAYKKQLSHFQKWLSCFLYITQTIALVSTKTTKWTFSHFQGSIKVFLL